MWYPRLELKAPNTKELLFLLVNTLSHLPNLIASFIDSISSCHMLSAIVLQLVFATDLPVVKKDSILFSILKKKQIK